MEKFALGSCTYLDRGRYVRTIASMIIIETHNTYTEDMHQQERFEWLYVMRQKYVNLKSFAIGIGLKRYSICKRWSIITFVPNMYYGIASQY